MKDNLKGYLIGGNIILTDDGESVTILPIYNKSKPLYDRISTIDRDRFPDLLKDCEECRKIDLTMFHDGVCKVFGILGGKLNENIN